MVNYTFLSAGGFYAVICGSVCHSVDSYGGNGFTIRAEYSNGFGVSIVKNNISEGNKRDLWELAVIEDGRICFDTPVADDIVGYLDESEVIEYCERVRNLV